jgi:hypothetical protein
MTLSRRNFLKTLSSCVIGSSLISCTHKKFFNPDEDIILSGGSFNKNNKIQNCLVIINLTQQQKRIINTPFLPHGINIDPNNKYHILCFEKNGDNACEIDLQTQTIIRNLHSEDNQLFSGHASFSPDGKNIYCIERNITTNQGMISVREIKTFNTTHQLPTLGLQPHDCSISMDNKLTVSNTGQSESGFHKPSLVAIDLNTEKLIERIKLDNDTLNCAHFKTQNNGNLIIASASINTQNESSLGGVSIRINDEVISTMAEPAVVIERMTGEALSIETNQQQTIAAITHPQANMLTYWSINNKTIIKAYGFENPRGLCLTLDEKYFVISYGNKPAIARISIKDLTPQTDSIVQPTLTTGEHILNWSVTLREIMPTRVYG